VVRSTHGVNCTGSCSWKVYVKDGIITWESQQTDYPSVGPDRPEYEPRGCPRGAAFSWYTYSPTRVRYPYVRGVLLQMYREAKARPGDPVAAWAEIVGDPEKARRYKSVRGKGGLVRATWEEATELDEFRADLAASLADGSVRFDVDLPSGESYRRPIISIAEGRIPASKARELRDRLVEIVAEYVQAHDDPDGMQVRLLVGYYGKAN
jgi:anaerobic selenocysteine-containing dehydrogenase